MQPQPVESGGLTDVVVKEMAKLPSQTSVVAGDLNDGQLLASNYVHIDTPSADVSYILGSESFTNLAMIRT